MQKRRNAATLGMSLLQMTCLVTTLGALTAACATPQPDDELFEEAASAVVNANALNPNALNPNALNPNALNPNALNPNALNPNALNPNSLSSAALTAITDPGANGAMSRELLKYTVSCALSSSQSFAFSWTDSSSVTHSESYPGLLALATGWASSALGTTGQYWVSACLASRVNWYGVHVDISSRGNIAQLGTTYTEIADYPMIEGAFFGNLFASTPTIYACYNHDNISTSRIWQRDCATGHLNANSTTSSCGILTILGDCSDYCSAIPAYNPMYDNQYYSTCYNSTTRVGANLVSQVVTTALPAPEL
jgi:hypothetical protein